MDLKKHGLSSLGLYCCLSDDDDDDSDDKSGVEHLITGMFFVV